MQRRIFGAAAVALTAGVAVFGATAGASPHKAAKGRADSGTVYASIVHSTSAYNYAAGEGTDKLLGKIAITYRIKFSSGKMPATLDILAKPVVLYTRTGSLTGTATATVVTVGTTQQIKNGKLNLSIGKGSLAGHSFVGTFTGTGSLAQNQFTFNDKGTYR